MQSPTRSWLLATAALLLTPICAQTFTSCNPLDTTCPADPALGGTTNIDFANGASSQFTVVGAPTYDGNGAHFSVAQQGDAPTITSKWYIMFGRVDVVMQAAPGTGIVSSMVLQSNDLDEIDLEWLGGDDGQVQSNYFGKGLTTTYNRGAFHAAPANHDSLHTYSVEWTSESVTWFVNGSPVRTLTAAAADPGQYPQTPMQLKLGVWAGGDPSNAPGTIQWAGGPTNYGGGPYTMTVKSVAATDYSTGQSYTYGDTSGTWQSIKSNGGAVYSGSSAPAGSGSTGSGSSGSAAAPSLNNVAPSKPSSTTLPGIPSGWVASATAHVVDPSSAASIPAPISSSTPLSSPPASHLAPVGASSANQGMASVSAPSTLASQVSAAPTTSATGTTSSAAPAPSAVIATGAAPAPLKRAGAMLSLVGALAVALL